MNNHLSTARRFVRWVDRSDAYDWMLPRPPVWNRHAGATPTHSVRITCSIRNAAWASSSGLSV